MTERTEQQNQDKIKTFGAKETYRYLGILEADIIKQAETKEKNKKKYLWRKRKLLEIKRHSRNRGIKTWAVSLVRCLGLFFKWVREELQQIDQRTRKVMTMHKALHPRNDEDRLYV